VGELPKSAGDQIMISPTVYK